MKKTFFIVLVFFFCAGLASAKELPAVKLQVEGSSAYEIKNILEAERFNSFSWTTGEAEITVVVSSRTGNSSNSSYSGYGTDMGGSYNNNFLPLFLDIKCLRKDGRIVPIAREIPGRYYSYQTNSIRIGNYYMNSNPGNSLDISKAIEALHAWSPPEMKKQEETGSVSSAIGPGYKAVWRLHGYDQCLPYVKPGKIWVLHKNNKKIGKARILWADPNKREVVYEITEVYHEIPLSGDYGITPE